MVTARLLFFSGSVRAVILKVCAVVMTLLPVTAQAQAPASGRFVDHVFRDGDGEHKFVVFEPAGYTPSQKWPLIFYLHGASGRGSDGRAQLVAGLGPAVKARAATLPFLVVFPQNENLRSRLLGGWNDGSQELDRALKILDEVERTYSVDRSHEVLAGVSMGAFGAWKVAADAPQRWKAVIAVSGGGEPGFVPALTRVPVWAFHAADDQLVPPERSSDLVAAINAAGGRAFVSIVPKGGHNIGAVVLEREEVFQWMLHPERQPVTDIDWSIRPPTVDLIDELPFVPGADVASAARIRVNQDLLTAISMQAADRIPADALQGWKEGRQEQQSLGRSITVGGIHYSGQIERVWITTLQTGRIRVQVGIRNMTMTVTDTRVQGVLLSADAGPMSVLIGFREPVYLTVEAEPQVVERRVQFRATAIEFQIPDDNWQITRPSVSVRGLPFLEEMIADRLVDGLAEKKGTIEQSIRDSVPQLLAKIETQMGTVFEKTVTARQWPMPLWQPRFRFYPESVAVDEHGLELTLGATVAALAPKSRQVSVRTFPAQGELFPKASLEGLDMAVSMRLLNAYSALLSASDVARFHVLDLNGAGLRRLGTHDFWNSVLPVQQQIDPLTELNTEFVLSQPFRVQSRAAQKPDSGRLASQLELVFPQLQLQLASRRPEERTWTDVAVVNLGFRQPMTIDIRKPTFSQRNLKLDLDSIDRPSAEAQWLAADNRGAIDATQIGLQFGEGWSSSFSATRRDQLMKDLALGQLSLRWEEIGITPNHLVARLRRLEIRVHNSGDTVAEYQVRSSASAWSRTWQLQPGSYHDFAPQTPIIWRSGAVAGNVTYMIPLGTEAQLVQDRDSGKLHLYRRD